MSTERLQQFEEDAIIQEYFEKLKVLVSKKSIFAQQVGLLEVASLLRDYFHEAGADEVVLDNSYAAPFVMAKFLSNRPDAKTIIFYNHYDTVPADGDQTWTGQPFEVSVRDGFIYGRGVDDDKGHITARLSALKKYQAQSGGSLPVHVIFIAEGAEESASVDLDLYLQKYKEDLSGADLLVWEQGHRNQLHQLEIAGGFTI